jgi:hypothetical protein
MNRPTPFETKPSSPHLATLRGTVDLRLWIHRCQSAGIPIVPSLICPHDIPIDAILAGTIPAGMGALSSWTERHLCQLTASEGRAMWRWSHCAPIEIKAAMAKPHLPVRIPCPADCLDDERFLSILSECRDAGDIMITTIVRPWIVAAVEAEFPVEFRVFVTREGSTSTSSYYSQRALSKKWIPFAEKASLMAQLLRRYVPTDIVFSADFLVTSANEVLFLEGGPMPINGADPCCLEPDHPFGDGCIALEKLSFSLSVS